MSRLPRHTKHIEKREVVDIEAAKVDLRRLILLTLTDPFGEVHQLASHAYTMLIGTENEPDLEEH